MALMDNTTRIKLFRIVYYFNSISRSKDIVAVRFL